MQDCDKLRSKKRHLSRNRIPSQSLPHWYVSPREVEIATLRFEIDLQKHKFYDALPEGFPGKIGITLFCACFYMHGACLYNKCILYAALTGFFVVLCQ
jgi:hypothetical protein